MTNKLMDIANEEINRRAFDRAYDWATDEIFSALYETEEFKNAELPGEALSPAQSELMDAAYETADASGELEELLEPENELYTRAYNREEAEYMFHVLAAGADEGNLDAHFEFLKPFGITRENIWIEEEEESLAE